MTKIRTGVAVLSVSALAVGGALLVQPGAGAAQTLRFSNTISGPPTQIDLGAPGLSVGDAYFVSSSITSGPVTGRTAASCVVTSLAGSGIQQCSIDFLTNRGVLSTHGVTDTAHSVVRLVVAGGTGHWSGQAGSGTLTPTPSGSDVVLVLR